MTVADEAREKVKAKKILDTIPVGSWEAKQKCPIANRYSCKEVLAGLNYEENCGSDYKGRPMNVPKIIKETRK